VPFRLFASPWVAVCTGSGLALNFAFYGMVFVLALYFQQVRGASPVVAGLMFLPMTGLIAGTNVVAGRLAVRYGPRLPLVTGELIASAGLLGLLAVEPDSPTWLLFLLLVPLGLGGGLAIPPLNTAMMEAVPAERSGVASGILNSARQVGGALGVAVFGVLISVDFVSGMRISLVIGAALALASAIAALLPPRVSAQRVAPAMATTAPS
jgi:MFS transporter, DHA2 family, methylenomycin A resistance protein